jgi:hypothetical protein
VAAFHSAGRTLRAGQRAAFTVRLTRRATARLRHALRRHRVEVALRVTATDAAGNRRVRTPALTLRRR